MLGKPGKINSLLRHVYYYIKIQMLNSLYPPFQINVQSHLSLARFEVITFKNLILSSSSTNKKKI